MKSAKLLVGLIFLLVLFAAVSLFSQTRTQGFDLMPFPAQVALQSGQFRLSDTFTIAIQGEAGERTCHAAARTLRRLSGRTGLSFKQDFITSDSRSDSASLVIQYQRPGRLIVREDESYRLQVTSKRVELTAVTDLGILRGLETLLQLLSADDQGYYLPAVEIEDQPRFVWRGLLIDVCRHFMPLEIIKRNLDGMAAVKMNVLHWHLSEYQGFRVECKTFPRLHQLGSDGFYYTQAQIKEVIDYAAERGIRVLPEFDMPGHATSWFVGYPELASAPGPYQIERGWGVYDPAMDPTREDTYRFLDKFLKEMSQLFPDEYFHIGGDEVNGKQWDANPRILAFMKAHNLQNNAALQSYFTVRIQKILAKYGKKMVGWDEILQPEIPKDVVIHSWRGRESLYQAAQNGYPAILSSGYYIDQVLPAAVHYANDPLPEDAPLSDEQRQLILGGEATMWAEFVSPENIDSRIWPRTAAIAERLWSPADIQDVDEMYRRLTEVSFRLEELGLTHQTNYLMMLRRLANGEDIAALKTFIDVVEPVKLYQRAVLRQYYSFDPQTRLIDCALPDAVVARNFNKLIAGYLSAPQKDQIQGDEIKDWLTLWQQNHAKLLPTLQRSPILREVESLSADLTTVAGIGLTALARVQNGPPSDSGWAIASLKILAAAKKPRGEAEIMVIPAIEKLVNAAGGRALTEAQKP